MRRPRRDGVRLGHARRVWWASGGPSGAPDGIADNHAMRDDERPVLADGVEVHTVEDGCVVYVPVGRGVHFLNEAAMLALELCDGTTTWARMQAEFDATWGAGAAFDVRDSILPALEAARIIVAAADPS